MHRVELTREARAALDCLYERDRKLCDRMDAALDDLAKTPRLGRPLTGTLKGRWSLRVGAYRVIYRIENARLVVLVLDIGHRRDVYR